MDNSWLKHGNIFNTDGSLDWSHSHAQVPVVDIENEGFWRVYYSTRNILGQSNISFIDVESGNPKQIMKVKTSPILELGEPGTFDDSGLMPTCIITVDEKKYLYYIGWTLKKNVPYQNSIGLAVSYDNGDTFQKISKGPILGMDRIDPYFTGTFYVLKNIDTYLGYYLSCIGWKIINDKMEPLYDVKIATSDDGVNWKKKEKVAIPLQGKEGGIASATVIKGAIYRMWYSVRQAEDFRDNKNNSYKIGYAESMDGVEWLRKDDEAGISLSSEGWDSQMIAYPYAFVYLDTLYLFYNGNEFGKTGFGYATRKND